METGGNSSNLETSCIYKLIILFSNLMKSLIVCDVESGDQILYYLNLTNWFSN